MECFDIVAVQIKIAKEKKPNLTKLTKKMIENGRVVKTDRNPKQK